MKHALYAEEGVRFYVIADPESKELTILELDGDSYTQPRISFSPSSFG